MNTLKKFWIVLAGAALGMVIIACSCGPFFSQVISTPVPLQPVNPMPGLDGYWQFKSVVFTIAWQGDKYVVTAVDSPLTGTRTLTSQSWDGSSLTWIYEYSDSIGSFTSTFITKSLSGDTLTVDWTTSEGNSEVITMQRISSTTPVTDSLPYYDDFSDPNTGWLDGIFQYSTVGYEDGYYFVLTTTPGKSSWSSSSRFYGDTVIDVDSIPVSGPANNNFAVVVGCRMQYDFGGYKFYIGADGTFMVEYYTGGAHGDHVSLLTSDQWQPSSAINPGLVTNHLTVTCAGTQFKLEVNGQVLYEGQDSHFSFCDVSLGAATYEDNSPADVHFDNLAVTTP